MCPEYALRTLQSLSLVHSAHRIEQAMSTALDEEGGYPKKKALTPPPVEAGAKEGYKGKVYRLDKRAGPEYSRLMKERLPRDFPLVPNDQ